MKLHGCEIEDFCSQYREPSTKTWRWCVQTVEQLYQMFPHLKEKLEAQLAKIPTEKRDWFVRNQTAIFAKLQQQHRIQSSAATPVTVSYSVRLACWHWFVCS